MNELLQKTWNGDRISPAEALQLYALPLETLGALAHRRRELAKAKAFEGRGNEIITFTFLILLLACRIMIIKNVDL